jgi:hypothetical protein
MGGLTVDSLLEETRDRNWPPPLEAVEPKPRSKLLGEGSRLWLGHLRKRGGRAVLRVAQPVLCVQAVDDHPTEDETRQEDHDTSAAKLEDPRYGPPHASRTSDSQANRPLRIRSRSDALIQDLTVDDVRRADLILARQRPVHGVGGAG